MCNSYRIKPKQGAAESVHGRVSATAEKLGSSLVRKSDPGIVVLADDRVEVMRWGFLRSFNPSINNSRSDKLESGMWSAAFYERRCVIPMSLYYEWGPSTGGRKQAHEFRDTEEDYLWVAGIWEENPDLGPCYSMVTTGSSPVIAPIHDRMPALLRPEEMQEFLVGGGHWNFQSYAGPLAVTPCESPLVKRRGGDDSQQELF